MTAAPYLMTIKIEIENRSSFKLLAEKILAVGNTFIPLSEIFGGWEL